MQLTPVVEHFGPGDQSWLGSRRGVDTARTVTLDATAFASIISTYAGYIPSGVALAYNSSTKKHEPYDHTGSSGTAYKAKIDGFLVADVPITIAPGITPTGDIVAAMLDTGRILVNRLPIALGTDTPTDNGQFVYVEGWVGQPVDGNASLPVTINEPEA